MNDFVLVALMIPVAANFGWYLLKGARTGRMEIVHRSIPAATIGGQPLWFCFNTVFNVIGFVSSVWAGVGLYLQAI